MASASLTPRARRRGAKRSDDLARGFDRIVYEEEWATVELWVADLESGKQSKVSLPGSPHELGFSPDGSKLALWVAPSPSIDDRYMKRELYVWDLGTRALRRVASTGGKVGSFAWSPDGSRLALVAGEDANDPKESGVVIADAGGAGSKRITDSNYQGHVQQVAWLSDENLVMSVAESCEVRMVMQSASGGELETLVSEAGVIGAWVLDAECRRLLFTADTAAHPAELFAWTLAANERPRRLTRHNAWLSDVPMGKQRVVRYRARDGLDIEGVLIEPVNAKAGQSYPLILVVHGGPEAHFSNGWLSAYSRPGQMAASRGYAVFHPNYRSSTGRGVDFSKLGQAELAGPEFDDLVDGVDHLIAEGLVDKKRVGVTGGSYGGYASAWCATRYSDRFAASVMFVGIRTRSRSAARRTSRTRTTSCTGASAPGRTGSACSKQVRSTTSRRRRPRSSSRMARTTRGSA